MKAAVYKEGKRLEVEEVPDPRPDPDEVVLKVSCCAICGSDLHRYAYGMMAPGTIMGHEFSGEVVEVGKNVTAWKPGDRVTRCGGRPSPGRELPNFPPRYSARERGFMPQKPGGYAQYMAIAAEKVMRTPESVTDLASSLIEPLTVAVHAMRLSRLKLGDTAVALGAGPIGLFVLQCANLVGASKVYVSEISAARLKAALTLGATRAIDAAEGDLVRQIVDLTGIGADVAFECAGAKPTLQQALELVKWGGQVMLVSLAWEPVNCFPVKWVGREVEMKACYAHLNSEWAIALALIEEKKVQTAPMLSKVIPLEQIEGTFRELLEPGTDLIQVVVKCN